MTAKYFALLTNQGAARLANAAALGTKLNLTQLAVGDGGGSLPVPDTAQTRLINEKRRAPLNILSVDPVNTSQIIAEQIIPESEGGYWIREIGLYDDAGVLIAVANCPETYKPLLTEGSGRTQTIRLVLIVSATDAVALKVDPAVVLATRKYVDDGVIEVKSFTDKQLKAHEAKANPHSQYLLIKNALKEIADAGLAGEVLENLGLKDIAVSLKYGAPLIGELVEWPHEKMPQEIWPDMSMEFIPYMAQSFDPVKYPLLSKLHPKNKLPADMRAQVARGWDNGRGIDTGRVLMSEQGDAVRNITGTVGNVQFRTGGESGTGAQSGVFKMEASTVAGNSSAGVDPARVVGIDISKQVPTAAENRVKSVAWNFIVRAK